ncbi:MAG: hypothetical protein R3B96_19930 [Pirellulaceae bacterium]
MIQAVSISWDSSTSWQFVSKVEPVVRGFSMCIPGEKGIIMLNVRVASPLRGWPVCLERGVNIFSLRPGRQGRHLSGPYGEFFIKDTDAEMVYIGGGAGMAPLRSHIFELFRNLKTGRKVSYWYGGRSKRELFYVEFPRDQGAVPELQVQHRALRAAARG